MEDIIYILAAVAWVVYAFYKNSKKGRRKAPQNQPAQSPAPGAPRDFKSILEEILTGEEKGEIIEEEMIFEEEEPVLAERIPLEVPVTNANIESIPRKYFTYENQPYNKLESLEEGFKGHERPAEAIGNKETSRKVLLFNEPFDLRKAVIYSTILDRPYK